MKRIFTLVLAALMIFSVAQCVAAEVYLPDAKGSYTISYEDARITNGEAYGFVVVEGLDNKVLDLSDDNLDSILYINQVDAANGKITFEKFGLRGALPTDEAFVGGTAFIGGKGFDTATTIGTLEAEKEDPVIDVTSITLDKTAAELEIGATLTLAATVLPADATDKTVTWTSSDATVASVDANGVVTAHKASATAVTITAKAGDATATCAITVKEPAPAGVLGDANDDGDISVRDALLICQDIAGQEPEINRVLADVNKDDELSVRDALLICQKIAGNDDAF